MRSLLDCSSALSYNIMLHCWQLNDERRPSFKDLMTCLEKILQDGRDYLDLGPVLVNNPTYESPYTRGK